MDPPPIIGHHRGIDRRHNAVGNYHSPMHSPIRRYIPSDSDSLPHPIQRRAIDDTPAVSIGYYQYLHKKLPTLARLRAPSIHYFYLLSEQRYEIRRYAANQGPPREENPGWVKRGDSPVGGYIGPSNLYGKAAEAEATDPDKQGGKKKRKLLDSDIHTYCEIPRYLVALLLGVVGTVSI